MSTSTSSQNNEKILGSHNLSKAVTTSSVPTYRDLFGRDDVEILRVDGHNENMPSKITVRVGENAGVFALIQSTISSTEMPAQYYSLLSQARDAIAHAIMVEKGTRERFLSEGDMRLVSASDAALKRWEDTLNSLDNALKPVE